MISPVILSVELKQRCLKSYTYRSRLLLLNKAYLTFSEGSIKKIHVTLLNKAQEGKREEDVTRKWSQHPDQLPKHRSKRGRKNSGAGQAGGGGEGRHRAAQAHHRHLLRRLLLPHHGGQQASPHCPRLPLLSGETLR